MKVLWTHNFNPHIKNSGVFMYLCADGVRKLGIEVELLYLGNLRSINNLIQARNRVKKLAREYDIVHSQFGSACAFATAGVTGTPKVISLRGSDWYWYNEKFCKLAIHGFLSSLITRQTIHNYDVVVSMSHRMEQEINKFYPEIPVRCIPDPINIDFFKPVNTQIARKSLGFIDKTHKWVLFTTVSQNNPIKRVPLAIEAVSKAIKYMSNIQLRFASNIAHEDMPLFVASCDLILCTSVYEGWPNAVKEALACNVPFVSTDVSDLKEIASQEASCFISPPDSDVLARNICEALSYQKSKDLRRHIMDMDLETVSKKYVKLYDDLVLNNHKINLKNELS